MRIQPLKCIASLALVFALSSSCATEKDLEALQDDHDNLLKRVEAIELWESTVNQNVTSLLSLIEVIQARDEVKSVTTLEDGSGYILTFVKSNPIFIRQGEIGATGAAGADGQDGVDGKDGDTPQLGVALDADNLYYWTLQTGNSAATWLLDANGNKVPTTGKDGASAIAPQIRINDTSNEWEISTDGGLTFQSTGVLATGAQGDAIFMNGGIDLSDPDVITFTLADKVTQITIPRASTLTVGFEFYEVLAISRGDNNLPVVLSSGMKASDVKAWKAEVETGNGYDAEIVASKAVEPSQWQVAFTAPTFTDGVLDSEHGAKVTVRLPLEGDIEDTTALVRITMVTSSGKEISATRTLIFVETAE